MATRTGKRAALLARTSKEDKKNPEKSIRDQIASCSKDAERLGLDVIGEFADYGTSASPYARKGTKRPDFDALVGLIESGGVDYVVMFEQSRLARDIGVIDRLRKASRRNGVRWILNGQEVDPADKNDSMMIGFRAVMDEGYTDEMSERIRRGVKSSAEQGKPSGKPIYGYLRSYDPDTRALNSVTIVPEEAAILHEIRDRLLAKESLRRVCIDLTDRGVLSPHDALAARNKRPLKGNGWDPQTVKRMALNPVYIAKRVHQGRILDGVKVMWEPIYSVSDHRRLTKLLADPARKHTRDGKVVHYLSGLVKCGECGANMRLLTNRQRYRAYVCSNRKCFGVSRAAEPMEQMVKDAVIALATRPAVRKAVAAQQKSAVRDDAIWTEIDDLSARLDEVREAIKSGAMSVTFAAPIAADLEAQIAAARKRAEKVTMPDLPDVDLSTLAETWDSLEPGQQRAIASVFVTVTALKAPRSSKFNPDYVQITPKA